MHNTSKTFGVLFRELSEQTLSTKDALNALPVLQTDRDVRKALASLEAAFDALSALEEVKELMDPSLPM
jgi:hypothetical protein